MRELIEKFEQIWCETMHTSTMWPMNGKYRCGTCLRIYEVPFEIPVRPAAPSAATATLLPTRGTSTLAAAR